MPRSISANARSYQRQWHAERKHQCGFTDRAQFACTGRLPISRENTIRDTSIRSCFCALQVSNCPPVVLRLLEATIRAPQSVPPRRTRPDRGPRRLACTTIPPGHHCGRLIWLGPSRDSDLARPRKSGPPPYRQARRWAGAARAAPDRCARPSIKPGCTTSKRRVALKDFAAEVPPMPVATASPDIRQAVKARTARRG